VSEPEKLLPSCQVELYAWVGSGCDKHPVQRDEGVLACHPPTNDQVVLFVSSTVILVRIAYACKWGARKACRMSAALALTKGAAIRVLEQGRRQ
jgi:hypothetical protein